MVEAVDGERHDFQTGDTIRWVTKRNETERNGTAALVVEFRDGCITRFTERDSYE